MKPYARHDNALQAANCRSDLPGAARHLIDRDFADLHQLTSATPLTVRITRCEVAAPPHSATSRAVSLVMGDAQPSLYLESC